MGTAAVWEAETSPEAFRLATLVAPPDLQLACLPLHPRLVAQAHPLGEAASSRRLPALLKI